MRFTKEKKDHDRKQIWYNTKQQNILEASKNYITKVKKKRRQGLLIITKAIVKKPKRVQILPINVTQRRPRKCQRQPIDQTQRKPRKRQT